MTVTPALIVILILIPSERTAVLAVAAIIMYLIWWLELIGFLTG
jgi:hypothetical protein